jgi:predicted DNA-binding ribbon-helix-helix protein
MSVEETVPWTLDRVDAELVKPEFRVVAKGASKRGIRLERIFWQTLKVMAQRKKTTIGSLVEKMAEASPDRQNLASMIRVSCLLWIDQRLSTLEMLTAASTVNSILSAVPSPAFALGANKKIVAVNAAFQALIRRQFPTLGPDQDKLDLKLTLDVNVTDLLARLEANGNTATVTGFAIGVGERRFRRQINAIKAPVGEADIVLAFVVG